MAHGQCEKWSKIIYFVTVKLSPICMIVPKAVICLFLYYTTDLGPAALELPIQELSVQFNILHQFSLSKPTAHCFRVYFEGYHSIGKIRLDI